MPAAMPPYPGWAQSYLGQPLKTLFPQTTPCKGNVELVLERYGGTTPGVKLEGWDYETAVSKPVSRVLLVDSTGIIVGAGEGGMLRYDVPKSSPDVASNSTGWIGYASLASGWIEAWGIAGDPQTVCRIGGMNL